MTRKVLVIAFAFLGYVLPAFAIEQMKEIDGGKNKLVAKFPMETQVCFACHAKDGNSPSGAWPKIAGQYETYLLAQLKEYQKGAKGKRNNAVMLGMVQKLDDKTLAEIAHYYAQQELKIGAAAPKLVELGTEVYRGGNLKTGVSACIACHGPQGLGNERGGIPRISGQHAEYTVLQLQAYKSGQRISTKNGMMQDIAKRMTLAEMKAVASYMAGLH